MVDTPLDPEEFRAQRDQETFWALRAHALGEYVSVEQALCALLAHFGSMDNNVAGAIFFKIGSARARAEILTKLLKLQNGGTYSLFFNSLIKHINSLDERRNSIVHWSVAADFWSDGEKLKLSSSLRPPNYWGWNDDTPEIDSKGLKEFIAKCKVMALAAEMFLYLLAKNIKPELEPAWRDIFQRELVYPLPPDHRLSQTIVGDEVLV